VEHNVLVWRRASTRPSNATSSQQHVLQWSADTGCNNQTQFRYIHACNNTTAPLLHAICPQKTAQDTYVTTMSRILQQEHMPMALSIMHSVFRIVVAIQHLSHSLISLTCSKKCGGPAAGTAPTTPRCTPRAGSKLLPLLSYWQL